MKPKKYTYIDLFSGCGGLSLGLHNAKWQGLFAIEKSKDAFETLKFNLIDKLNHFKWPNWLPQTPHNIYEVLTNYRVNLLKLKGKVTLVAGGPPCQGFSMAGRRNESDDRNKLIDAYIEFISLVEPNLVFFENVKGFTIGFKKEKSRGEAYSNYVTKKLHDLGYGVSGDIIDFSEYGIPQRRKRFILIGVKGKKDEDVKVFFKNLLKNKIDFLISKGLNAYTALGEAISDLLKVNGFEDSPDRIGFKSGIYSEAKSKYQKVLRKGIKCKDKIADSHSFPKHTEKTIKKFDYILKNAEKNTNISDEIKEKFKLEKRTIVLLDASKVTPTLTTLPDDYIHYCEPRILTVREYARIQSFPDWFEFKGKYTTGGKLRKEEVPRYTQIGNAIPPLFGEQCGLILNKLFNV
jgi:DNA (cytosine-5)-methyltransferase 1